MSNPTKTEAVARNALGQVVAGSGAINPGGLTVDERSARDALRKALAGEDMRTIGLAAYKRCLEADNPVIVKDFMDRVLGKVKERVTLEDDEGNAISPLAIMLAQYRALPRTAQDALEEQLAEKARIDRAG